MKNKKSIIVLIILLAVGFAAVSTTLVINGVIGLSFGELDVYYSKAVINGVEDNSVIKDKTHIEFDTTMTLVGEKYRIDYDVTNGSKNYDAEISMNCDYETEDGGEYLSLNNIINTDDLLEAMTTRTGHLTIKMIKSVTEPKDIHITCEIVATPRERDKDPGDVITKEPVTLVETILSKANDASIQEYALGDKGEVYAFSHDETEQMGANTDYRYIGNVPNNYITYNEGLWRVIGVFEDENGVKRAKVIRDTSIGQNAFGNTSNFASSTIKMELERHLNDEAYEQIDKVNFYVGPSSVPILSADTYYANERSKTISNGNSSYVYNGKVGLLYVSDYYYTYGLGINDACFKNSNSCTSGNPEALLNSSWMYKNINMWTMNTYTTSNQPVYYVTSSYGLSLAGTPSRYETLPVAYLNSDIIHSDGDGTQENPYVINSSSNDKPDISYGENNLVKQILIKKNVDDATYDRDTGGEVFAFEHVANDVARASTDYRYIGESPNNYITFDNETFRIIGVFEDERGVKRAKIVRNNHLVHCGDSGWSWTDYGVTKTNFENTNMYKKALKRAISDGAMEHVDEMQYYMGGITSLNQSVENIYNEERTSSNLPFDFVSNVKAGIPYMSDFFYTYGKGVNDTCYLNVSQCNPGSYSNSWLYNGRVLPFMNISRSSAKFYQLSYGVSEIDGTSSNEVREVLYLKPDTISLCGDGSQDNPYVIESHDSRDTISSLSNSNLNSGDVEKVTFVNAEPKAPENAILSWDASDAKNGSIIAYILDEDNNDKFELYVAKKGKIYAHKNSSSLLSFSNALAVEGFENFSAKNVDFMWRYFSGLKSVINLNLKDLDTSLADNMTEMFAGCKNLVSLDVSGWDTSNVTQMRAMFDMCEKLKSIDLSSWNTSSLTEMTGLFEYCYEIEEINLQGWNTSKVTNMQLIFDYCKKLKKLNISTFDTSNVTDMTDMFMYCQELEELDLSHFDTSKVTKMLFMFDHCVKLKKINVSSFNTSNVTDMSGMFGDCSSLISLDVSHFDTRKVTGMHSMFVRCSSLEELNLSNFITTSLTGTNYMFQQCTNLRKLNISGFYVNNISSHNSMFNLMSSDVVINVGSDSVRSWILDLPTVKEGFNGPDRPAEWSDANITVQA